MTFRELTRPSPTTVLIVDDEDPVLRLVDRVLTSAGYVTRLASNGAAALAIAETAGPFDLLVTDMMMPEMNGTELARRLREKQPSLKVLYCTGYSDRLFEAKGGMWEDEAFLEKPYGSKGLLEAVSLLCSRNRRIGPVALEPASVTVSGTPRTD